MKQAQLHYDILRHFTIHPVSFCLSSQNIHVLLQHPSDYFQFTKMKNNGKQCQLLN